MSYVQIFDIGNSLAALHFENIEPFEPADKKLQTRNIHSTYCAVHSPRNEKSTNILRNLNNNIAQRILRKFI